MTELELAGGGLGAVGGLGCGPPEPTEGGCTTGLGWRGPVDDPVGIQLHIFLQLAALATTLPLASQWADISA